MRRIYVLTLSALFAAACAQTPPERAIIEDAAEALGGADAVMAVQSLTIEGEGTNGNLGQNITPEAELPLYRVTGYRRTMDFANHRARLEQTRTATFAWVFAPQAQNFIIDGDLAFNIGANGQRTGQSERVAKERANEYLHHHPIGIVRAALDPAAQLSNYRAEGGEGGVEKVDLTLANSEVVTLAVDATTKLPVSTLSMAYNANLGDVAIETTFAGYEDVANLKLPTRLSSKLDQYEVTDITITDHTVNAPADGLAGPAGVEAAAAPVANVTVTPLGAGLWFLSGQSHNSLVAEFSDHLKLVEVPQNETRALAVIAKARELKPDKPLTHVVVTHHHFDHSRGLRAAVSEGLTIITHESNEAFFKELAARTHSIVQDALARNPRDLQIETVGDERVVEDRARRMEIYHLTDDLHAGTAVVVYFPRERVLFSADSFGPTTWVSQPWVSNLLATVDKRKLRVSNFVPVHGVPSKPAEVAKLASS